MPWRADASRLEAGNPSLLGLAVLDSALARLERLAPEAVERHAVGLGGRLIEGLRSRGFTVLTPEAPAERGGNVCFLADDAAGLAGRLAGLRVLVWGGEGRIRVSPHVHCDGDDVERFFEALDRVGRAPRPGGGGALAHLAIRPGPDLAIRLMSRGRSSRHAEGAPSLVKEDTRMEALLSLSNDLAGAVERAAPSIVAVHARRRLPSTGIHWRAGIVVTADHTVRMEDGITVETADGRARPAALVGRDPGSDLAVLRVADLDTAPAALGDDGALRVGHMVLALGYGPRASWGVISALGPRWRTWRGGEIDRLRAPGPRALSGLLGRAAGRRGPGA